MGQKIVVNNKPIFIQLIKDIIKDIKKKKGLSNVDSEFVREEIVKYLKHSRKALSVLATHRKAERSSEYRKIVKHIRAVLRRACGAFQTGNIKKKESYLKELECNRSLSTHNKILRTHSSTNERLQIYPTIYKKIFLVTGKPKVILDLACGLNPVSFPYMGLAKVFYFAADLNKGDVKFVKEYFKIMGIEGDARAINLLKTDALKKLPSADICFLLKTLETIELTKSHKVSEQIIRAVPAKWIVVSFATKTIEGKRMRHPRRGWIEMMLKRLGYGFTKIVEENEIFYVIKRI